MSDPSATPAILKTSDPSKFCKIVEAPSGDPVLFVKAKHPTTGKFMIHVSTWIKDFEVVALTFDFPDRQTRDKRFDETDSNDAFEARKMLFEYCLKKK